METPRSAEQRRTIDEQLQAIKACVDGFELFVPKDETALDEIAGLMQAVVLKIAEMDEARLKRKRLMAELDRAFSDLEDSQKKFVEKVKPDLR
jgi:ATP-dependent helicase/DNAse subunit B